MATLNAMEYKQFEEIKHCDKNDVEFWLARELAIALDYTKWENFSKVIDKAMLSCQNSGFECADHFLEVRKMVRLGSGSERKVKDYQLSRYACYLIVQNGDPRKAPIALGQTVREPISKNDGTMPEDLPTPEKSIAETGREQIKQKQDLTADKAMGPVFCVPAVS